MRIINLILVPAFVLLSALTAHAAPAISFSCLGSADGSFLIDIADWDHETEEYTFKQVELSDGRVIEITEIRNWEMKLEDQSVIVLHSKEDSSIDYQWTRQHSGSSGTCERNYR